MRLRKYHGLGNDFLILFDLDGAQPVDAATVAAVCDRHRGVGADGLIRVTAGDLGSIGSDVTMELRNADGSRAETSGNGLRCVARAVVDAGLVAGPDLVISTDVGDRRATVGGDGYVSVDMGHVVVVEPKGQRTDLG
ncbi:MAG: diaminopimelate epimerase, partial [Actinomycetota bacterium]|nr:diaminopimelate epimerase [Actinomycetota bacterium]